MKIVQKIVFYTTLLVGVSYFIFTLSFSSGWALGEEWFEGFYQEAQIANKLMYQWALYAVVFAFLSIVFQSHSLRRYSIFNYLFAAGTIYTMVQAAIITSPLCHELQASFDQLNPIFVTIITAVNLSSNPDSVFEIGHLFSSILWIQSIILFVFLVLRFMVRLNAAKANKRYLLENTYEN